MGQMAGVESDGHGSRRLGLGRGDQTPDGIPNFQEWDCSLPLRTWTAEADDAMLRRIVIEGNRQRQQPTELY